MRTPIILVLILLLLAVCGTAQAQCTINTSYGVYDSVSIISIPGQGLTAHVISSLEIDGSASMSGSCGDLTYVTHQPQTFNSVNNIGGWSYGSYGCASCYLSDVNDQDSGPVGSTASVNVSVEGEVVCSAAGLIFSSLGGGGGGGTYKVVDTNYDLHITGVCSAPQGNITQSCVVRKNCPVGTTESCPGPAQDTVIKNTCGCGQHFNRFSLKIKNTCVIGAHSYTDTGAEVTPCS
jgi:hypothetical protein